MAFQVNADLVDHVVEATAANVLQNFAAAQPTAPPNNLLPAVFTGSIYERPYRHFSQDLRDYGVAANINDERRLIAMLPRLLRDAALVRYRQIRDSPNPPDTLDEIDELMEQSFPFGRTADSHMDCLRMLLYGEHGLSVEQLASRIRQSASIAIENAEERERQMNYYFVYSLPAEVRSRVFDGGDRLPPNFEESVQRSQKVELNLARERQGKSGASSQSAFAVQLPKPKPPATPADVQRFLSQLQLSDSQQPNNNFSQLPFHNRGRSSWRSRGQGPPSRGRRGSRRGGYQRRQWNSQWQQQGQPICFRCELPGHTVQFCPSPPANGGQQGFAANQQQGPARAPAGRGAATRGNQWRPRGRGRGTYRAAMVFTAENAAPPPGEWEDDGNDGTYDNVNDDYDEGDDYNDNDESGELYTFDDPNVQSAYESVTANQNCFAVTRLPSAKTPYKVTEPLFVPETDSARDVHVTSADSDSARDVHVTFNTGCARDVHANAVTPDRKKSPTHQQPSPLLQAIAYYVTVLSLLLAALPTSNAAAASEVANTYFAACSNGQLGQAFSIPKPSACVPPPVDSGAIHRTRANVWAPELSQTSLTAYACTIITQQRCTNYGFWLTQVISHDKTTFRQPSVSDCQTAWKTKSWQGVKLSAKPNQPFSHAPIAKPFSYNGDDCVESERLILTQGNVITTDGRFCSTDIPDADVSHCHWLSGQCTTTTATIYWQGAESVDTSCQYRRVSATVVYFREHYAIAPSLQTSYELIDVLTACNKQLWLTTSNALLEFPEIPLQQPGHRKIRSKPARATVDFDDGLTDEQRTQRALARQAQYFYTRELGRNTTGFSEAQLAQYRDNLALLLQRYHELRNIAHPSPSTPAPTTTTATTVSATTADATTTAAPSTTKTTTVQAVPRIKVPRPQTPTKRPGLVTLTPTVPEMSEPPFLTLSATAVPTTTRRNVLLATARQSQQVAATRTETVVATLGATNPEEKPDSTEPPAPANEQLYFSDSWQSFCQFEQQRLAHLWSLFRIDPNAGARVLFGRDNAFAILSGSAIVAWQCPYVNVSQVYWDHKVNGQCFEYTPVQTDSGVMFIVPGSNELTASSFTVNCNLVSLAIDNRFDKWHKGTATANVLNANALYPLSMPQPLMSKAPLSLRLEKGATSHNNARRLAAVEQTVQNLVQLVSLFSLHPEPTKKLLRGYRTQHWVSYGQKNPDSAAIYSTIGDTVSFLQSGKWQVPSNLLSYCTATLLLCAVICCILKCAVKRLIRCLPNLHCRRHPDSESDDDGAPLQELRQLAPGLQPLNQPTTAVIFPQSLGQLLRSVQNLSTPIRGPQPGALPTPHRPPTSNRPSANACESRKQRPKRTATTASAAVGLIVAVIGSSFRNPFLEIELNTLPIRSMVDTGASINLISEAAYSKLAETFPSPVPTTTSERQPSEDVVLTVEGKRLKTRGQIWLQVSANKGQDIQQTIPFTIVADLELDCILGIEFLTRFPEVTFNWREKFLKLGSIQLPISGVSFTPKEHRGHVQLCKTVKIPARSKAVVAATVRRPYSSWPELLFLPNEDFEAANNLLCAASLAVPSKVGRNNSVIPIELINSTQQPIVIYGGANVGQVSTFQPEQAELAAAAHGLSASAPPPTSEGSSADCAEFEAKVRKSIEKDCPHLTKAQRSKAVKLLVKYRAIFSTHEHDVGFTDIITHRIPTVDDQPVALKPYKTSIADRPEQERHVKAMLANDIIEPAERTSYNAPVFLVRKKGGGSRWIVDYRGLNLKTIAPAFQQLPSIDTILSSLGNCSTFGLLDQTWGFYQLSIAEEDRAKTAFSIYSGERYQFKRMGMGLCGAPHSFQKAMNLILAGLNYKNVLAYLDDVIIFSPSFDQFCEDLSEVFERLLKHGIKLRLEKCELFKSEIKYLGFVISSEGLKPAPDKIQAVQDITLNKKSTLKQLQSFLGVTNFCKRFIRDYAKICLPLTNLTRKDNGFRWTKQCDAAVAELKQALCTAPVLGFPDFSGKPFVLCTDASLHCIGAVLMQTGKDNLLRPLAYFSKKLTPTQSRYSCIEREAFAISQSLKHFRYIVHRHRVIVFTDHQPLVALLRKQPGGTLDSPRLSKWALSFQSEDVSIHYLPGKSNTVADFFSRVESNDNDDKQQPNDAPAVPNAQIAAAATTASLPVTVRRIQQASLNDPTMSRVLLAIKDKWPDTNYGPELQPFMKRRKELTVDNNVVLLGTRVVVPPQLRKRVLEELHQAHPGIVRMRSLARLHVWWPRINEEIEELVSACQSCNEQRPDPPEAPLHPLPFPHRPFARVHIDHAGEFLSRMFFVLVDAHSKWAEAFVVSNVTSATTIRILSSVFARFGIPDSVASDNSTTFTSAEFANFCKSSGIRQILSSPNHPRSNGEAEVFVKTMKSALRAMTDSDIQTRLDKFLASYRQTPHSTTKRPPAEVIFSFKPKSTLDLMNPIANPLSSIVETAQQRQIDNHDSRQPNRNFAPGDPVWVRSYRNVGPKWLPGVVTKINGPLSFEVKTADNLTHRRHTDQLLARQRPQPTPNAAANEAGPPAAAAPSVPIPIQANPQNAPAIHTHIPSSSTSVPQQPPQANPQRKIYPLRSRRPTQP